MRKHILNIKSYWKVVVFIVEDYNLFGNVISSLRSLGCSWENIKEVFESLYHGKAMAFTYSNLEKHTSVMVFGKHNSKPDFLNSIVHECEHVKQAMLKAYKVEDKDEPPAYTMGYLVSKMISVLCLHTC